MTYLDKIDKEALLKLCLDCDIDQGCYPDNEYEGQTLYEFLLFKRGESLSQLGYTTWQERESIYDERLEAREKATKENINPYRGYFGVYLKREMERKEDSEVEEG